MYFYLLFFILLRHFFSVQFSSYIYIPPL